jgi:hypothetical protein
MGYDPKPLIAFDAVPRLSIHHFYGCDPGMNHQSVPGVERQL